MWKIMVLQRFYGCLFCSSKKSLLEKMGDVGRFAIGECVTAKAINFPHLSECTRRSGSDNKTKRLVGLVVTNVNKLLFCRSFVGLVSMLLLELIDSGGIN